MPPFGAYRLFLASLVAFSHTGNFHHLCGSYAVFAFFTLSGYVITQAYQEQYRHRRNGMWRFYANRLLRIYPLYWLAIAMAAVVAFQLNGLALWGEITRPETGVDWLENILILGPLPSQVNIRPWRLLSVSWSLHLELFFYAVLPFVMHSRLTFALWLAAASGFFCVLLFGGFGFMQRYFTFHGAMVAFASGGALYTLRLGLPRLPRIVGALALFGALAFMCYPHTLLAAPTRAGFYVPWMFNLFLILYLSGAYVANRRLRGLDDLAGRLAYPVFLFNLPVAELSRLVIPSAIPTYSWPFFMLTWIATLLFCLALLRYVEAPLERVRLRIRRGGSGSG